MALPLRLNRRHKVALFLILVFAGIAALSGAKMMEVVGIFLLGLAFGWAVGSDSRVFHWLFLSIGIVIACAPICFSWYDHRRETNLYAWKVADFEQRIPELAKEYPLAVKSGIDELSSFSSATGKLATKSGLAFTVAKDNQELIDTTPENSVRGGLGIDYKCYPDGSCLLGLQKKNAGKVTMPPDDLLQTYSASKHQAEMREVDQDVDRLANQTGMENSWQVVATLSELEGQWETVPPLTAERLEKIQPQRPVVTEWDASGNPLPVIIDSATGERVGYGVTRKLWNEARAAGLDLSIVPLDNLPGEPPERFDVKDALLGDHWVPYVLEWQRYRYPLEPEWLFDPTGWRVAVFGVFLFASGLVLILGIRSKPLPS